ncbi:lipase family protein [soil metagenome]
MTYRLIPGTLILFLWSAMFLPISTGAQTPEAVAGRPGDLLRAEPLPTLGDHPMWRILYVSTDLSGEPIPVTGIIAVPGTDPGPDGVPLLAVGHPTSGVGRQCAPSLILYDGSSQMASLYRDTLVPYLDAGFAIVMPDYQGLGAAGDPSYLIGTVEGANILDSIRAARVFDEVELTDDTLLSGHSQGGHAVAFAVQMAPLYAPDLSISGAVLAAPALDPRGIFDDLLQRDVASADTSLILFVLSSWDASYGDLSLNQITTPLGRDLIETSIRDACLIQAGLAAGEQSPSQLLLSGVPAEWDARVAENTPDPARWKLPALFVHGDADEVISPSMTGAFVDAACTSDAPVKLLLVPGADHFGVLAAAEQEMLSWLIDRTFESPSQGPCGLN